MKAPKPLFKNPVTPSRRFSNSAQSSVEDNAKPTAKWEGKAAGKVNGVSADKVWSLVEDYGNVHKWLPTIDATTVVEGEPGKLGCVRRCSGPPAPGSETPTFTNEKLVEFDPATRTLSYRVLDNNIGFGDFVATWKVVPDSDGGSTIEWSFVSAPIPYWEPEKVQGYIGFSVQGMAKAMEEALSPKK
ncbi:lachrymatory-factor synthase-like [Aristolochia californica]|uniref:lachrymatory-factor synthase-like n=1 Tax=Aristolochia californica TaxID=171875 RepID=UPI0035DE02D3